VRYATGATRKSVNTMIQKIKNFFEWFKLVYWFVTDDRDICDYPDFIDEEIINKQLEVD
jgi:hypothetical protein